MMLSEDELPPTPQEKLFIKHSVNECRASLAASTDDLARAIMDPILDRLIRALKKDVIEVECKPEDDWVLKVCDGDGGGAFLTLFFFFRLRAASRRNFLPFLA
jgi:hypothetical protein